MGEAVLQFCKAKTELLRMERATRDDRTEQNDATRTLGGLLSESMQRHEVRCVALPPAGPGQPMRYVKVTPAPQRACAVKTDEDGLALLTDLAAHLRDVPAEALAPAVVKLVRARAKERGPPRGPPRVSVVAKAPAKGVAELPHAPAETRRLATDFAQAHAERQQTREALKPLRAAVKASQAVLVDRLDAPATVRMDDGKADGATRTLCVQRVEPPSRSHKPPVLCLRSFLDLVREAAQRASEQRRDRFEANLRTHVVELLAEFRARAPAPPKPRIKVTLAKATE